MSDLRIVFCTTCKGRVQHVEQTLPRNLADNACYRNAKFVVLDYNSPDHLSKYLQSNHQTALESERLVVYSLKEPGPFRMAHAKNVAHRVGLLEGADILVNLDADNFTGKGFACYLAEKFQQTNAEIFLWAKMIKEGPERLPRGISGRIAVSRQQFINSGGYDEKYETWSPDDKDFNLRLRRMGYPPVEIENQYLNAIRHNDKLRFKEYNHAAIHPPNEDDVMETVYSSDTTVANFGNLGQGVVFKNFDTANPVQLSAIPTRIFGIGMHKTGTTSLHHALKELGYDSAHWKSAHWAKAIWEEMIASGKSTTLERHYAVSDLPVPLLYEKLDRAYPGSKFILTIRDEQTWLQSVRNHWSHDSNKHRAGWSNDPFTHKVHKLLYGQKGFDAEIFLGRFRQHNAEVREYFKDRPQDLLIMNMDQNAGWPELCAFLQRPIPASAYPVAFPTRVRQGGLL